MDHFNFDLLRHEQHDAITGEFVEFMFSHLLYPMITKPTHITSNTTFLMDDIFTNDVTCLSVNGLIVNDLSDHLLIFSISRGNFDYDTSTERESIVVPDFKDEHVNNFHSSLEHVDWENLDKSDANSAYESFVNKFSEVYYKNVPEKTIQLKYRVQKSCSNPQLAKGLLKSIRTRAKLYQKLLQNPSVSVRKTGKTFKNSLNHLIRIAKKTFYDHKLAASKNDIKTTWKILIEGLSKRKSKLTYPSCFKSYGELFSDPTSIATSFSKCFSNIGPNLAARISPSTANLRDFLRQTTQTPSEFQPLTADELKAIVHSFNSFKASVVDNIPMRIIKLSIDIIVEPLTEIINLSLVIGCFPDTLKIAKVLPIFRTGDPEKLENYRPISILPAFSKLYKKSAL